MVKSWSSTPVTLTVSKSMAGTLYLVGTPIGNLGDLSPRAQQVLESVDRIACESPQAARRLLSAFNIEGRLVAYREASREKDAQALLRFLEEGADVALISDAGMPAISDPGYHLVDLCRRQGLVCRVVPGPTAAISALVLSGFPTRRFCFEGFLPRKGSERKVRLEEVATCACPVVIYESPHRVLATLSDLAALMPDREAAVSRELTKKFESVSRAPLSELERAVVAEPLKGEFVIVVGPGVPAQQGPWLDLERARWFEELGLSKKQSSAILSQESGLSRKEVYKRLLELGPNG